MAKTVLGPFTHARNFFQVLANVHYFKDINQEKL